MPTAYQPAAIARVRDDAAPLRVNPLARLALRDAQYALADGRFAKSDGLLVKYAAISGQPLGRSARELVDLGLMSAHDPRTIVAQELEHQTLWRHYSRDTMVAEQKTMLSELGRVPLGKGSAKKVSSLSLMIRQNDLNPYQAAALSEGLSLALFAEGKSDLALKVARGALKAGGLHLFEQSKAAERTAQDQAPRRKTAAERAAELNR